MNHVSYCWNQGIIEIHQNRDMRGDYTEANDYLHYTLFNGEIPTIYVGYDSRHGEVSDVCIKSIQHSIERYNNKMGDLSSKNHGMHLLRLKNLMFQRFPSILEIMQINQQSLRIVDS